MKIDWKYLATTPGYKSLKAAYIKDTSNQRSYFSNKDFLDKFNWVICRAKHYAHHTGKPIEEILNQWEEQRSCWWMNFYQDANHLKLSHSGSPKPRGLRGLVFYYKKKCTYLTASTKRSRVQSVIHSYAVSARVKSGKKARWSNERKRQAAQTRAYVLKL